jgi:hypothetical protein
LPEDHLDDLRAQLPAHYSAANDAEVALLWVGLAAARRGHSAEWLVQQLGISEHDAGIIADHSRRHGLADPTKPM